MKRLVLQLMRTIVTVIVVGTMAAMIFSLRSDLAKAKAAAARGDGAGLFETVSGRASVRKFDRSRPVGDDVVERLLRAAMCAPSAMDRRTWEFIVVRDREKLGRLALMLPSSRIGNGAPLAIVVCGKTDNGLNGRGKEFWVQECSAATMNLLLAAKALGLGAVWTGVFPREEPVMAVREVLGVPEGYEPLNVIPVGWPAEDPAPKDKWDPGKIHHDGW